MLLDWSQNNPAKTTICPYSMRGRDEPWVAAPADLGRDRRDGLRQLRIEEVLDRVEQYGDLAARCWPAAADPALMPAAIECRSSGVGVPSVELPDVPSSSQKSESWLRRLSGYCLRHPLDLATAFGSALLGALVSVSVPLVIRHVVDAVDTPGRRHPSIDGWIALLVVFALLQYVLTFVRRYTAGRLSLDVQYDLRGDIFTALQRLDGAAQDELQTGQVVSRSISDVGLVQGLLAFFPALTGNFLLFVISLIAMAWLSPVLTLVALAIAPALFLVARRSRLDLFPANWSAQQQSGELVGHVEAAVTGVRVVKGFGQERRETEQLSALARILFALRMRVVRFQAKYSAALTAIPALGQLGRAAARWLAGAARPHHHRYLPGLLHLPRSTGQPGPSAVGPAHHRPAGPGRGRAGARGHRLLAGRGRCAGCPAAARRPVVAELRAASGSATPSPRRCFASST